MSGSGCNCLHSPFLARPFLTFNPPLPADRSFSMMPQILPPAATSLLLLLARPGSTHLHIEDCKMMTRSGSSVYGINDSLSPSDRELFSLFLQYPEIDLDEDDPEHTRKAQPSDLDSSPLAIVAGGTSTASTSIDTSDSDTTLTTPVRPPNHGSDHATDTVVGDWDSFILLIQQSNLPEECLRYHTSLAEGIVKIGTDLFATARPNRLNQALLVALWLLKNVTYSMNQASAQVEKIGHLKRLTAFNVTPTGPYLWTTYMQRAKLITG